MVESTKVVKKGSTRKRMRDKYINVRFFIKKCKNIWSCEKKVVTLHDFSRIVWIGLWEKCAYVVEDKWVMRGGKVGFNMK